MQKRIHDRLAVACAVALTVLGVSTVRADVFNGVDWGNNVYDPGSSAGKDGLPTSAAQTSPVWAIGSSSGTFTEQIVDDAFRLTTDAPGATYTTATRAYKQTTNVTGYTGTFEFRMRVVETNRSATYAAQFILTGGGGWVTSIAPTFINFGTNYTPAVAPTQWHTYRLTMEQIGGGGATPVQQQLKAYLDGELVYSATRSAASGGGSAVNLTEMRFGDGSNSTGTNGTSEWDYIRWTTTGAYAPVIPEPATWGLLTLGALAIFARRR